MPRSSGPATREKRTATLSFKYEISFPKAVREKLDRKPAMAFAFLPKNEHIVLVPNIG